MTELTGDRPAISAGIITQNGAVLLVQRKVKEGSLSWQFPAGEVEPGEPSKKPQPARPSRRQA